MSSEWIVTTLGEVCTSQNGAIQTGPFGSQLHASDYVETGIPVVMPSNIGPDGGISEDGIARIRQEDADRLSQHKLQIGDVVFSRRGDVTRNALIEPHQVGWLCGTGCLKVRLGNEAKADAKFISYCLRLPETKEWLIRHAVGATMPNLNTSILSAVPIQIPPITEQKKITNFLRALDDRINLLREINATLEAIAQTLFKSWFVDFDPVHANAGTQAPSLPPEIQALFPATFTDSPQGPIPEGWSVKACQEIIDVRDGTHASPKPSETGYPLVTSRHIASGELSLDGTYLISEAEFLDISKRSKVDHLDVLLTMIGTVGIPALVLSESTNFAIKNIGLFKTSKRPDFSAYIYLLLKSKEMQNYLHARMAGTTQKYLSLKALREIAIIEPTPEIIQAFSVNIRPIFEGIQNNRVQVQALTDLRDTLLPRLISGQLRLPEEEQAVAAITGYANV